MKTACPRCGANVTFMPSTQKCYCEYCGSEIDVSEFNVEDFEKDIYEANYDECTCSTCGAKLLVGENTTITRCVYCGSNQIIKNRFRGEFKPDEIIPFKIDNDKFLEIYRKFVKKKILAPNKFRNNTMVSEIKGMYVPFQIFTIDSSTYARGEAKKESDKNTYYKYFETEYDMELSSPQDASTSLDDDIMTSLEPFSLEDLKDFNPVYLNGFSAENGNENIEDLEKKARLRGSGESNRTLKKKLKGYQYTGGKIRMRFSVKDRKYALLPVWFFNTPYMGKQYSYALNGQTGKVVGEIPLSKPKFWTLMTILGLIAIVLTVFVAIGFSGSRSSRRYSDDDDDGVGAVIAMIWMPVISTYTITKARYKNVKKVLDNPLVHLKDHEKMYREYSRREYKKLFGAQDYVHKDIKIDEEGKLNV
ncbi:MAG: hypothetical protein IJ217_05840 [Clostridia bacterium]|nr:hypothetical protein [Clostridia bacterium]